MVNQTPIISSIKSSPITSLCTTSDSNHLFTADSNGYITVWSLNDFLGSFNLNEEIDLAKNVTKLNMIVCWRGHLSKIIKLTFVDTTNFLFSASIDESVR